MRQLEKFTFFLLTTVLLLTGNMSMASQNSFTQQLENIVRFSELQHEKSSSSQILKNFSLLSSSPDKFTDEEKAESLGLFAELLFSPQTELSSKAFKAMYFSGKASFVINKKPASTKARPFTEHVIEAIKINKARAKYYSQLTGGKSESLSRLYTTMEYSLIPLSLFMDRWARKFQKAGIPVLLHDFVSMEGISSATAPLIRNGALDDEGRRIFRRILREFQKNTRKAASDRDFMRVQQLATLALHELRHLELTANCNLAMSVHLVESIGLAGRNAQGLSVLSQKKTDFFYKSLILLQNAGVRMFSIIDLQAHQFHQHGVGIIVNDLPPIPFP